MSCESPHSIYKCRLVGDEQRVRELGLQDRVEVRIQDYRDVPGRFDRIVSVVGPPLTDD